MEQFQFSERVRHVFLAAVETAKARRHEAVGTEHQLLALLADHEGVASAVLDGLNVDREAVVAQIDAVIGTGSSSRGAAETLPHTTRAKRVIELMMAASRELDHPYIGVEHLLLALIREGGGVAAQALAHAGVTDAAVREETLRLLG